MESIKIYVACLASYNAGKLHGTWIDLSGLDGEDTQEMIQKQVIKTSPQWDAEEWAIHDFESPVKLGEWEDLEDLCILSEALEDHGEAFAAYVQIETPQDMGKAVSQFTERYCGHWESFEQYVTESHHGDLVASQIPSYLLCHFDWESYARDLEQSYLVHAGHVFYNN